MENKNIENKVLEETINMFFFAFLKGKIPKID